MTITLVERENELASLDALLRASMLGRCRVALVSGAVGSGRTELLHTFAESAMDQGAVVLTALASEGTRSAPMGVLSQLLRSARCAPQRAESISAVLAAVTAGTAGEAGGEVLAEETVLESLHAGIAQVAADHPVVIAVDDMQEADAASLDSLLYLMRRLRYSRVLFVLNESEHKQRRNPLFRVELLRQPGFRRIRLGPLSVAGVQRLLAPELGGERAAGWAARYHAVSGGNPLLVRALLDDSQMAMTVTGDEPAGGALEVGDSYGQAVLACLHRGSPTMLAVARALAVLDGPGDPETVERLLDLDARTIAQAIEDLVVAGFVADGGFRHPRAGAAVLSDLPADQRAELHRSAARLLHTMGASATSIAHHLLAAGRIREPWVAEILRAAAGRALREDQAELSIEFLGLATRVAASEEERLETAILLLQAEWRVNPALSVRHLGPLAQAYREGRLPGCQAIVLAKTMLWHGRLDEAVELLERLSQDSEHGPEAAAQLGSLSYWLRTSYPGLLERLAAAPTAGKARASLSSFQSRAAILLSAVLTGGGDRVTVSRAEQILQASVLDDTSMESIEAALLTLLYADQPGRAAAWCDSLLAEATARQIPTWTAVLCAIRAEAAIRQGDLPAAERHGQLALRRLTPRSWGLALGAPLASLVLAKTAMGKHEEAAELISHPIPPGMLDSRYGLHYLYARGRHHLACERFDAAVADFLTCGDLMGRWGIDQPALIPWRSAAATALLRLGEREQAERLAEEQLIQVGEERSRTRGITLRALAEAGGPGSRRPALLREAVTNLQAGGDQLELAHALAELGLAHRALGEADRFRALAEQALRLADECACEPLRELLLHGLKETPGEPGGPYGAVRHEAGHGGAAMLSDAELRVAALASLGFTNREIASRLYVTVSTVEQHLTRVYRKLKVGRRADLPTDLQIPLPRSGSPEPVGRVVVAYRSKVELNSGHREVG
ncbi:ATP-binding protein [Kitasatospora sp. NPDC008050]|uniref:ATP-binding protein n=1 Tax=Kitasatospora sp. NPDC008050 TaxID=3364021 RepID=UPI0036E37F6B